MEMETSPPPLSLMDHTPRRRLIGPPWFKNFTCKTHRLCEIATVKKAKYEK